MLSVLMAVQSFARDQTAALAMHDSNGLTHLSHLFLAASAGNIIQAVALSLAVLSRIK